MTPLLIACLLAFAVYIGTKRLSGLQTSGLLLLTLCGIVLVIFPDFSTQVAHVLHVGRGTDLLFYLAILAGLFITSNFYFRFKRNEETMVKLVRDVAIERAEKPGPSP